MNRKWAPDNLPTGSDSLGTGFAYENYQSQLPRSHHDELSSFWLLLCIPFKWEVELDNLQGPFQPQSLMSPCRRWDHGLSNEELWQWAGRLDDPNPDLMPPLVCLGEHPTPWQSHLSLWAMGAPRRWHQGDWAHLGFPQLYIKCFTNTISGHIPTTPHPIPLGPGGMPLRPSCREIL